MVRKITLVTAIALVLGTLTSVAYSAGQSSTSREASGTTPRTESLNFDSRAIRAAIKSCPSGNVTLQCVNKNFNKLRKAFNKLVTANNALQLFVATCLLKTPITRYGDPNSTTEGYLYDLNGDLNPEGKFPALDFTFPGDAVSAQMIVSPC